MQKTDGTIKTMNKIKDVNSHRNLVVNNPSRLGNMEIVPGTGELRISVKGEGSNPPFTIVLPPSGYEQLKQPLEQFASLYKKVNGAEDAELNSPTQAEFLGIPFNYFHTLSPDGSRIESYGYYGEGPITSNTQLVPLNELMTDLTIYLTNSFTTSAGYEEDVRSLQVDTFRD